MAIYRMRKHLHQPHIRERTNLQNIKITQEIGHQKNKYSNKKWVKDSNRELSMDKSQMAARHLRKYSTSLAIREMHIKTTPS